MSEGGGVAMTVAQALVREPGGLPTCRRWGRFVRHIGQPATLEPFEIVAVDGPMLIDAGGNLFPWREFDIQARRKEIVPLHQPHFVPGEQAFVPDQRHADAVRVGS